MPVTVMSHLSLCCIRVSHREWFSSFSSGRLGCVHLDDGSAHEILGAGDVCLSFESGASLMLCHVRYVPDIGQSLISYDQLIRSGCHVALRASYFQIRQGCLVVARGVADGGRYPLTVDHDRDGVVSVRLMQPFRHVSRRVSFVDELQDARVEQYAMTVVEHVEPVHDMFIDGHVEQVDSMDAQGESSCVMAAMAHFDADDVSVIQSFLEMLMSETDACTSEHDDASDMDPGHMRDMHVDVGHTDAETVASTPELAHPHVTESVVPDMVRLCEIARVASAFGSLMYDILVSRPEVAFALGAFVVGVVSCAVADIDIQHGGVMQVVTTYL